MLPKQNRLQLRKHQAFFSNARKKHTTHFVIFIEQAVETTKVAVIVPAKQLPLAVDRNNHKRVIRAVVAKHLQESPAKPNNVVIYCKRPFTKATFETAYQELKPVFKTI